MTSSTEERRAARSALRGISNGTWASERVRLARTMRWATVGSATRKARAISSVVRPPSKRRVSATRPSGERTGWQEMKTRRRRSSPTSSSIKASRSGTAISCCASSSRPNSWCLRSRSLLRRQWSIARCLAVAMSQAPGLSGMPDCGHCSSAATRASCASSSAMPTSRTMRVSPAMMRADSMRQTASMALWVAVEVTATHHTIFKTFTQADRGAPLNARCFSWCLEKESLLQCDPAIAHFEVSLRFATSEVFGPEHLANLRLAFPAGPVFFVKFHELHRAFDGILFGFQLELRVASDNLLGLCERTIGDRDFSIGKTDAGSERGGTESAAADHAAGLVGLFAELVNGLHQLLGRMAEALGGFNNHHEFHGYLSSFSGSQVCARRQPGQNLAPLIR